MAKNVPEQGRTGKRDLRAEADKEAGRRATRKAARESALNRTKANKKKGK